MAVRGVRSLITEHPDGFGLLGGFINGRSWREVKITYIVDGDGIGGEVVGSVGSDGHAIEMKRISILPDIIELKFGLQSRVESSWLLTTRVGERRLWDSVVLWVEVEDNLVSNTCRLESCVS